MGEPTDEELMDRFCRGEHAALDTLYVRHARPVHGFLLRMVRESQAAQDLLQATFLSVIRGRGRFEPGSRFAPWLYTIAANAARDALRRTRREAALPPPLDDEGTLLPEVSDPGARRKIEAAFAALPPDQREAVVLHKLEGWSFERIAEAFDISPTAARVRAHRGYEKLRAALADLTGGER